MSEAIILGAMQKLESFLVETPSIVTSDERVMKGVINEMRMVLDFLRDKKSGERSRRLDYLLADFAEMAQDSADFDKMAQEFADFVEMGEDSADFAEMAQDSTDHTIQDDKNFIHVICEMTNALDWLRKTRKRMMEFGVGEGVSSPQSVGEEGDEGVVVGLEKDVQQLIGKVILNEERPGLVTFCIKVMLGVGKTTLAKQVYNHSAIVEKFKRGRAWVSISSDTSIKEVLVELIQQLVEHDGDSLLVEEMDNRSLRQMLSHHLQGMPYFIVIDNMLPEVNLESFLDDLPDEGMFVFISVSYN